MLAPFWSMLSDHRVHGPKNAALTAATLDTRLVPKASAPITATFVSSTAIVHRFTVPLPSTRTTVVPLGVVLGVVILARTSTRNWVSPNVRRLVGTCP